MRERGAGVKISLFARSTTATPNLEIGTDMIARYCSLLVLVVCLNTSANLHTLHSYTTRPRKMAVAFVTGRVDMFDGDMEDAAATAAVAEANGCKVSNCRLACSRVPPLYTRIEIAREREGERERKRAHKRDTERETDRQR